MTEQRSYRQMVVLLLNESIIVAQQPSPGNLANPDLIEPHKVHHKQHRRRGRVRRIPGLLVNGRMERTGRKAGASQSGRILALGAADGQIELLVKGQGGDRFRAG